MGSTISMAKLFYMVPEADLLVEKIRNQELHGGDLIAALEEFKTMPHSFRTFDEVNIEELAKLPLVLSIAESDSNLLLEVYQSGNIVLYRYEDEKLTPVGIKPRYDVSSGEISMSEEQHEIIVNAARQYFSKSFSWQRNGDGTYNVSEKFE